MAYRAIIINVNGRDSTYGAADETAGAGAWDPGGAGANTDYFPAIYTEDFTPVGQVGFFLGHWPDGAGGQISAIKVNQGFIGNWVITYQEQYNLASGTPSAAPTDGVILSAEAGKARLQVYEDEHERARVGYISAGVYGVKVYDTTNNVIFEASDTQQIMASWKFDQTYLYSLVGGAPAAAPSDGLVLEGGATARVIAYENTEKRLEVGYLAAGKYGIKGYADDGATMVFEISDDYISLAGWTFTNTTLSAANISLLSGADPLITVGVNADWKIEIGGTAGSERIGSHTFTSGPLGVGWQIDSTTGRAEFQDIIARGKISTAVFEHDVISAVGGYLIVSNSDVLAVDMTAADASTLTIDGDTTFSLNEILRIKDGVDDEWLQVINVGAAPTYTVTRDLAASYGADANPIWKKGTAVVSTNVANGGYIFMDTSSANSPFMDIVLRNSATYDDLTIKVRLGDLTDITDTDFGIAPSGYGLFAENVYLKGTIVTAAGAGKRITINEYEDGAFNNAIIFYGDDPVTEVVRIDDNVYGTTPGIKIIDGVIHNYKGIGESIRIYGNHMNSWCTTVGVAAVIYANISSHHGAPTAGLYGVNIADSDTGGHNRYGVRGESLLTGATTTCIAIGVYGKATNAGSGAAWAGYFDNGYVYIKERLGVGNVSPTTNLAIGTGIGTFNGMSIGAAADRDFRIGQDSTHNLIMGWKYDATAADAYGILETYARTNILKINAATLVLQDAGGAGNVGIGTDNPTENLHVYNATGAVTALIEATGADEAQLNLKCGAVSTLLFFRDSDDEFGIYHKGTTRFRIESDGTILINETGGNVGINELAPNAAIDVNGTARFGDSDTNYSAFAADGIHTLHGTARVINHVRIGAASWKLGSTAPTPGFTGIFPHLSFADNADEEAHYTLVVPFRRDATTDITIIVDWEYTGAQDNGKVLWKLTYNAIEPGNTFLADVVISQLSAGTHLVDTLIRTEFTVKIIAANLSNDDNLALMLWRNGNDAGDTLGKAARMIATHANFTRDKHGLALA